MIYKAAISDRVKDTSEKMRGGIHMSKIGYSKVGKIISLLLVVAFTVSFCLPVNPTSAQAQESAEISPASENASSVVLQKERIEEQDESQTQQKTQADTPTKEENIEESIEKSGLTSEDIKGLPEVIQKSLLEMDALLKKEMGAGSVIKSKTLSSNDVLTTKVDPIEEEETILAGLGSDSVLPLSGDLYGGQLHIKSGNFVYAHTDVNIPQGTGPDLCIERTYNSQDKTQGYFGYGWRLNMPRLIEGDGVVDIIDESGSKVSFTRNEQGVYIPSEGHYETLRMVGQIFFVCQYKDGSFKIFHRGQLSRDVYDNNGNSIEYFIRQENKITVSGNGGVITLTLDPQTSHITRAVDYTGRTWNYQYDDNNNLIQVTAPDGGKTTYAYDGSHNLKSITTPNQNAGDKKKTTFTYTGGKLTNITDTLNNQTTVSYNAGNRKTVIETAPGTENHRKTEYSYDGQERITAQRDYNVGGDQNKNRITTYQYNDSNNSKLFTAVTVENGQGISESQSFTYDDRGNTLTETGYDGNTTAYLYDAGNNVIQRTDPYGKITLYTYDGNHNLLSEREGGSETTYLYENGKLIQETDAENAVTQYTYDSNGYPWKTINGTGAVLTETTYDTLGRIQEEAGEDKTTSYQYDIMGSITKITETAGGITGVTTYTYDKENRAKTETAPDGVIYHYTYDAQGNMTKTLAQDSSGNTKTEQNIEYMPGSDDIKTITDTEGNSTEYSYDPVTGEVDGITDEVQNTTSYTYDAQNRITTAQAQNKDIDGIRQTIQNTYTYEEDRLKTIGHNGITYSFGYNGTGDNTTIAVGNQNLVTNSYEGKNLKSTRYANDLNTLINYEYGSNDKITKKKANSTVRYSYAYYTDAVHGGQLKTLVDSVNNKTYTLTYDHSGRLQKITDNAGNSIAYSYRDTNTIAKITYNIQGTEKDVSYAYDQAGKPISTQWSYRSKSNNYDSLGRIAQTRILVGQWSPLLTEYSYKEGASGTTTDKIASVKNNGTAIAYEYDEKGNITGITQGGKKTTYQYDALNQLLRENNEARGRTFTYKYDTGGNIKEKREHAYTAGQSPGAVIRSIPYAYGASNWKDKLTAYDGKSITYDAIGNPTAYNNKTFTWETGRQLKAYKDTKGTSTTSDDTNISYKYNDSGIRTQKTVNGVTTHYYLEGDRVVWESDGSDTIWYTYDSNDNLISMNLNGSDYYYMRNAQNDVIGLVDYGKQKVVTYDYDSWGNLLSIGGSLKDTLGVKNPYRYRGYHYDTETGLYYLQSRYYNPEWGRFVNADDAGVLELTQGELLSHNLYAYCGNDPVNKADPSGYLSKTIFNKVNNVAKVLDALIIVISGGKTYFAKKAFNQFLKKNKNKVVYQIRGKINKMFGKMVGNALPAVIDIAMTLAGTSAGDLIARALDYADGWWGYKRNNGYILN